MNSGTKPQIVFFGSGPVAAASLELLSAHCIIEAVVTKPKPAHHRGAFPVLEVAEHRQLPIHTVSNKAELAALMANKPFMAPVGVLIDFGIIVGQEVIDAFVSGIVNSHFSLLPEWRGADPITFSILSGQPTTGVSLMLLVEALDEGPLLAQAPYDIPPTATTAELTEALIELSDQALQQVLPLYLGGQVQAAPQTEVSMAPSKEPTYSRKLTKQDGLIDWHKPAARLEREIRAFLEWPKSRTQLAGKEVIITKAHTVPSVAAGARPGDIEAVQETGVIMVSTSEGSLCIERLKPASKLEMTAQAFINGYGGQL